MERMVKYIKVQLQIGREMLCSALVEIPIVRIYNNCMWRFQHVHVPLEPNLERESSGWFGRALCSTGSEAECVSV